MIPTRQTKQAHRTHGTRYGARWIAGFASLTLGVGLSGCKQPVPPAQATIIDNNQGPDPANANLAPVNGSNGQAYAPTPYATAPAPATRYAPRQQSAPAQGSYAPAQQYPQQYAPAQQYPQPQQQDAPVYPTQQYATQPVPQPAYTGAYNDSYPDYGVDGNPDVKAGYAAIEEASQPPPPLPVYDQPPAPEQNDLWTPGYWSYGDQGYYWVPGAWCPAPYAGALWTPGYWGYGGNRYRFHRGFWARHIGFYGGIPYGHGYTGSGYQGGFWRGNDFVYNEAANRVNVTNIHNVYQRNVTINNTYATDNHISYNGGATGIQARPAPQELAVLREQRIAPTIAQTNIRLQSATDRNQFFNQNHGQPPVPVVSRVAPFAPPGLAPANSAAAQPATLNAARPGTQPVQRPAPPQPVPPVVPRTATFAPTQHVQNPPQYGSTRETQHLVPGGPPQPRPVPQPPPASQPQRSLAPTPHPAPATPVVNEPRPSPVRTSQPSAPPSRIVAASPSPHPQSDAPQPRPPFVRPSQPLAPPPHPFVTSPSPQQQTTPPTASRPRPQPAAPVVTQQRPQPAAPAASQPRPQVLQQPKAAPAVPQPPQKQPDAQRQATPGAQHQPSHGEHPN